MAREPVGGMGITAATRGERVGALDGLRAFAVVAVVVYHLSPRWLPSGYLGVDVFMVVSGFLITGLLISEHEHSGGIRLAAFWGRRFRRLVPALLLLLVVVAGWVAVTGPRSLLPSIRSQGLAALTYVANWKLISAGVTYGGSVAASSPLVHLWSLAVEEQFYLFWPPLLLVLLGIARGRRGVLVTCTALGAVASASLMWMLYHSGHDTSRVYYGTDTRAQAFLVGAVAALVLPYLGARSRSWAGRAGGVSLIALVVIMRTDSPDFLYRGGFFFVAVAAAFAVMGAMTGGMVPACLDHEVFRALGRVSYGIYLWHWPAITLLTPERIGVSGAPLLLVRIGVTAAGTAASWFLVERPLRRSRPLRVAYIGAPAIGIAAISLLALPAAQTIAYADVRTDRVPTPVVVSPRPSSRVKTAIAPHPPVHHITLPATGTAMIVGDSGMYDATPALTAGLNAAGWRVIQTAYPGEGLTRTSALQSLWATQVREYHVDLTIVMIGGWDLTWEQTHGGSAYTAVVNAAVATFTASGGKVEWLSTLPGGGVDLGPMEKFYRALPARDPATVDFLDIDGALRAPDGSYPRVVDNRLLRKPDGWHLCPDGADALAHTVLRHLGLDRGTWDAGAWRTDGRYDDPHGGCPTR